MCKFHGGKSPGAPKGKANGAYVHGNRTKEAIAMRRAAGRLLKELNAQ